jgi:hypothetical protein
MSSLPNPKEFASFKAELSKTIKFDEVEQSYDLKNIFDSLQNNSIPSGYISKLIDLQILEHNPKTKEILKRFHSNHSLKLPHQILLFLIIQL